MRARSASAVALAALMLVSMLAAPVGAELATADVVGPDGPAQANGNGNGPPDHASVPHERVEVVERGNGNGGGPGNGNGPPDHAAAWGLGASSHAGDLSARIVLDDGELDHVELTDDVNHEGRSVSVNASALVASIEDVDAVDELPDRVYGEHESGSMWSRELVVEDGSASWRVPHFSTNTITFESSYSINASPSPSGTSFQYASDGNVSDVSLNVTGVESTATDSRTATASNGDAIGFDVGGTESPRDAEVTLTGVEETSMGSLSPGTVSDGYSTTIDVGGNQPARDETVTLTGVEKTASLTRSGSKDLTTSSTVSLDITEGTHDPRNAQLSVSAPPTTSKNYGDGGEVATSTSWKTHMQASGSMQIGEINEVSFTSYDTDDSYGSQGDMRILVNGEVVHSEYHKQDDSTTMDYLVSLSEPVPSSSYTVEVQFIDDYGDSDIEVRDLTVSGSPATYEFTDSTGTARTVSAGGSTAVDLARGSTSFEVTSYEHKSFDWSLSADSVTLTEDPSATVGGSTVSHSGVLADGDTVTKSIDLSPGSQSADVSVNGEVGVDASWTAVTATEDPSVTVGGSTVSHTGILGPGETVSQSVDLSTGSQTADVTVNGPVGFESTWTEVTHTRDPVVSINGESYSHTGGLAPGESVTFSPDPSVIEASNDLTLSTSSPATGPESLASFNYSHESTVEQSVAVEGNSFDERYSYSRVWSGDAEGVTTRIPFTSDSVVGFGDVEVTYETESGSTTTVEDPSHSWDAENNTVVVELGDVAAGTTTSVSASARKVGVDSGNITVINPSAPTGDLDTRIRVDDAGSSGDVVLDVSGIRQTRDADRLAYAAATSWTDGSTHVELEPGTQRIVIEDAVVDGEVDLATGDLGVRAVNGEAEVEVIDAAEPRFRIKPGASTGDVVEATWYPAKDGATYELVRVSDDVVVDTAEASSPVDLRTSDTSGVYVIRETDGSGGGSFALGGAGGGGGGLLPPWVMLLGVVALAIAGLAAVSRRIESDRLSSGRVPITLGVGAAVIALVAIEVAAPYSLVGTILTTGVDSVLTGTFVSLVGAIGVLVGLVLVQRRTERDIPLPILVVSGALAVLWLIESLRPGAILDPLRAGLAEVGAAVWILGIGGVVILTYMWLKSRRPEIVLGGGLR